MIAWTSSGSRRSDIAVNPDTSENMTVTLLRSPSRAPLEVRIFSARCSGVNRGGDGILSGPEAGPAGGEEAEGVAVAAALGATGVAGDRASRRTSGRRGWR